MDVVVVVTCCVSLVICFFEPYRAAVAAAPTAADAPATIASVNFDMAEGGADMDTEEMVLLLLLPLSFHYRLLQPFTPSKSSTLMSQKTRSAKSSAIRVSQSNADMRWIAEETRRHHLLPSISSTNNTIHGMTLLLKTLSRKISTSLSSDTQDDLYATCGSIPVA